MENRVDQFYIEDDPPDPVPNDGVAGAANELTPDIYRSPPSQTGGGLMPELDQAPQSVIRRILRNMRGLRARGDDASLTVKPTVARVGGVVMIRYRMRTGERGSLTIGDNNPVEVGNGTTEFLAPDRKSVV